MVRQCSTFRDRLPMQQYGLLSIYPYRRSHHNGGALTIPASCEVCSAARFHCSARIIFHSLECKAFRPDRLLASRKQGPRGRTPSSYGRYFDLASTPFLAIGRCGNEDSAVRSYCRCRNEHTRKVK